MPRKPPTKTWKAKERIFAALFGTVRRPLSGGNGSHGNERDDAEHDSLFLECKYSKRHRIWSLWRFCQDLCRREAHRRNKRRPIIGLYAHGEPDKCLLVVHEDDLFHVAAARLDVMESQFRQARQTQLADLCRSAAQQVRSAHSVSALTPREINE